MLALESDGREGVLGELIRAVAFDRSYLPEETALRAMLERERAFTTAIGESTAVPHAKCGLREEMAMAFGISRKGIDFSAADGKPVRFLFMILTRRDVSGLHLKTLSRIARLIKVPSFIRDIAACATPSEALEIFRQEEKALG
jgi:mannitol/fructose-specific phosphotransferase system IIA component (Ntr-type)